MAAGCYEAHCSYQLDAIYAMQVSILGFHDINNDMDKMNINVWQTFHFGL